ncbi:GAF domain-containing hybrid sensor histidine kinase/response regulator [Microcoleus sp. FACHB-672]|uniref:hybrid sensor histidine kinase/response regulator n=1 Tax=Microcoleus sp. FACHB-672 TaxID=2692825 RepID=UPI0016857829|nr:GAF domain-containing hybrid sensor histidine kinase/response regulator [Microcoleus sp. FACHB-672]MBD2039399.1 response regulator [Microcoleus sp. FACHB-672]
MPNSQFIRRTLPLATFEQLRFTLLQHVAQNQGETSVTIAEDILASVEILQSQRTRRFAVVVSQRFSALLTGIPSAATSALGWENPQMTLYQIEVSFEESTIAAFLSHLRKVLQNQPQVLSLIEQAEGILSPNDGKIQSEFTLQLLNILAPDTSSFPAPQMEYAYSVCQPVEEALSQQIEQERVLNQVTAQIRQSLELPVILETAVEKVRSFLQVDRLVIYQFDSYNSVPQKQRSTEGEAHPLKSQSKDSHRIEQNIPDGSGSITYEARASDSISSVLHWREKEQCFVGVRHLRDKYRKGFTQAIEDIETTYVFSPCLLNFLREAQVKAKLVTAIVVGGELWGLLIAQQCFEPRRWQENEQDFLKQIAEHLAIAIYQAQLYAELQQQKQTLEDRVSERTQALYDALIAAQAASRAKSEFLATMSHELRTPLTCVIGMSGTLLRWSFGQLNQKQRSYLQTIHDSGEHLLHLINDILDLSQVEAGKTVLNISELSLSQLAEQSLEALKEQAAKNGVELKSELRLEPSQDLFIADERRLKQILNNLLSNAVKFTPEGGGVTLRIWLDSNAALFQVEDTGIGISENQRPLLFQKFQQLDTSYQRKYGGTGLGLALTKQLVELHGGWVEVESTLNVGSTFTVWLPAQPLRVPSSTVNQDGLSVNSENLQGRIVLVEDDDDTATSICDTLTAAGYQVVWMIEGSTAIEQIEVLQPTAVIIDMELPGMDGYEIIYHLRQSPAMQQIKVLVLKEKARTDNQEYCLAAGADDYLVKPIQPAHLLQKIATLTASQA